MIAIEAAIWAWLASLERLGLTREQAARDLEAQAQAFAAEGKQERADLVLRICQQYHAEGLKNAKPLRL